MDNFEEMKKRFEMRKAHKQNGINAIKDTLAYMPTTDIMRVQNSCDHLDRNYEFNEDATRITKAFGIEIMCNNPHCQCFALRYREDSDFLSLQTTFDFIPAKIGNKDKNLIWVAAFRMKNGAYFPSCYMDSLEDFIEFYVENADYYDGDRSRLVIVDDEPEQDEPDYEDNYEDDYDNN